MARSVWTGSISFGLVNVGVKAYTAVRDHDVHFNQLEKGTGARIRYEKVSAESGKEVDADDIEMGYEVSDGRYVTFSRAELDELQPESTRTIDVSDFVALADVDPIYYERTYWLAPSDEASAKAYQLLLAAMEERERVAIGTVVMRNKQYLTAIRPLDGALAMSTMRFADEVVSRDKIDDLPSRRSKPDAKALKLATQIVDSLAGDWNPEQYEDTYAEQLRELIKAKGEGKEVVVEAAAPERSNVVDLMAALEASVDAAKTARGSKKADSKTSRTSRTSKDSKGTKATKASKAKGRKSA